MRLGRFSCSPARTVMARESRLILLAARMAPEAVQGLRGEPFGSGPHQWSIARPMTARAVLGVAPPGDWSGLARSSMISSHAQKADVASARCPDVTFIWAHAGGTLVALAWRLLLPDPLGA